MFWKGTQKIYPLVARLLNAEYWGLPVWVFFSPKVSSPRPSLQAPGHSSVETLPPVVQVHSFYQPFHPTIPLASLLLTKLTKFRSWMWGLILSYTLFRSIISSPIGTHTSFLFHLISSGKKKRKRAENLNESFHCRAKNGTFGEVVVDYSGEDYKRAEKRSIQPKSLQSQKKM